MYYVLICGGRDYEINLEEDKNSIAEILNNEGVEHISEVQFITGNARGADQIPNLLYEEYENVRQPFKFDALWNTYGKMAGRIRNNKMLTLLLNRRLKGDKSFVIALPGGRGTEHMKTISRGVKIKVIEVD